MRGKQGNYNQPKHYKSDFDEDRIRWYKQGENICKHYKGKHIFDIETKRYEDPINKTRTLVYKRCKCGKKDNGEYVDN